MQRKFLLLVTSAIPITAFIVPYVNYSERMYDTKPEIIKILIFNCTKLMNIPMYIYIYDFLHNAMDYITSKHNTIFLIRPWSCVRWNLIDLLEYVQSQYFPFCYRFHAQVNPSVVIKDSVHSHVLLAKKYISIFISLYIYT